VLPPALLSDPRVEPRLRALVLRLLAVRPEERGTAPALAEALEQAAEHAAREGSPPCFTGQLLRPSAAVPEPAAAAPGLGALKHAREDVVEVRAARAQPLALPLKVQEPPPEQSSLARGSAGRLRPRAPRGPGWPTLALAAASLALAVWTGWAELRKSLEESSVAQAEASRAGAPDAGTAGLAAAAATMPLQEAPSASHPEGMSEDTPPEPLPGQLLPDEKGRCPRQGQVALNGGCWAEFAWAPERCAELGGQMFKGTCYMPLLTRGRRPNSSSMDKR